MAIKLVAFDLDGTTIGQDKITISDETLAAFSQAYEKGIWVVPNTGRTLCMIPPALMEADYIRYIIISNGAAIYDKKLQKFIYQQYIPYKDILWLFKETRPLAIFTELYTDGVCFVEKNAPLPFHSNKDMAAGIKFLLQRFQFVDNFEDIIQNDVEKASFLHIHESQRDIVLQLIKQKNLHATASAADNIEVNHLNANKGVALAHLCEILQIEKKDVMAFGDGLNDVEMLQWAGFSFAMDNACVQAKEAARFHTASNLDEGVTRMVKKHILTL